MHDALALPSGILFVVIFGVLWVSVEVGHRLGRRARLAGGESPTTQASQLQASVLGTIGLILGFAFSVALARFDARRLLVVEEANAIGTVYLRCDLLPEAAREEARRMLRRYTDLRLAAYERRDEEKLGALLHESERLQAGLWGIIVRGSQEDPRPVFSLLVSATNTLIDLQTSRLAAFRSHVPPGVVVAVALLVMLGMGAAAYAASLTSERPVGLWVVLALMISTLFLVIIDLDRPARGIIPVPHDALYYQRRNMS